MKHWLISLAVAASAAAHAGPWPDRPVHMVVPYPPGGNVDNAARIVSERLQERFNQPFLVENKPGAGGLIAGEYVKRATADGYTLFMAANGPLLYSPTIFKRDVYDWKRDFDPISSVSFTSLVLQVNAGRPYKTAAELVAAAKAPGSKLTMASPGAGTTNHLVSELLQERLGARWLTVQYKGNAPATTDLLGGQVDFNFDQVSVALPYIKDGRTRALAVTSPARLPQLPDVPTLKEAGLGDLTAETFTGLLAPKGTPKEVVNTLAQALAEILAEPGVRKRFDAMGAEARAKTPQQFTDYLVREDALWMPIIKAADINAK